MNLMKKTFAVFTLICIFGMAVVAGEPNPTSCSPTDGIMQTPPCASAQLTTDDPTAPEELETAPPSNTFDITSTVEEALMAFLLF